MRYTFTLKFFNSPGYLVPGWKVHQALKHTPINEIKLNSIPDPLIDEIMLRLSSIVIFTGTFLILFFVSIITVLSTNAIPPEEVRFTIPNTTTYQLYKASPLAVTNDSLSME